MLERLASTSHPWLGGGHSHLPNGRTVHTFCRSTRQGTPHTHCSWHSVFHHVDTATNRCCCCIEGRHSRDRRRNSFETPSACSFRGQSSPCGFCKTVFGIVDQTSRLHTHKLRWCTRNHGSSCRCNPSHFGSRSRRNLDWPSCDHEHCCRAWNPYQYDHQRRKQFGPTQWPEAATPHTPTISAY